MAQLLFLRGWSGSDAGQQEPQSLQAAYQGGNEIETDFFGISILADQTGGSPALQIATEDNDVPLVSLINARQNAAQAVVQVGHRGVVAPGVEVVSYDAVGTGLDNTGLLVRAHREGSPPLDASTRYGQSFIDFVLPSDEGGFVPFRIGPRGNAIGPALYFETALGDSDNIVFPGAITYERKGQRRDVARIYQRDFTDADRVASDGYSVTFQHRLATYAPLVQVYNGDGELVGVEVRAENDSDVTIRFNDSGIFPLQGTWRITVVGF